ncbi:MAG TPA: WD40 repeat domain-containing protein [Arachnia sp.]|nr:WD40 repeat domain-containing protein [Arachnia sp.]
MPQSTTPLPLSRTALITTLAAARRARGLSIRRAASVAGVAASTVQGWFEGRHLPTPALMPAFINLVTALGLAESDADRDAWIAALETIRGGAVVNEPPYVGLRAYTADDAALYVGRERAYEDLIRACVRGERVGAITVIVIGESGAGKSSLLGAGLIGRAAAPGGALDGLTPVRVLPEQLHSFPVPDYPCLIVVDQFEELQKLPPEQQRAAFDVLAALPDHATAVVALTADAFGFALLDERFASHLDNHVRVATLSDQEYARIVEEPAALHGRQVSPALTGLVLRDLHAYGEPSPGTVLPLLSSALRRSWASATGDTLLTTDYLRVGGLWASLDEAAETVHQSLTPEQHLLERRLMLSLVRVDGPDTLRRRMPLAQMGDPLLPVVSAFVAARLLSVRDDEVEIAHNALLTRWSRLRNWVDEESTTLLFERRIHMASALWDEGGRNPEALLPREAALWQDRVEAEDGPLLSAAESDFIAASLALAESQEREQEHTISRLRARQRIAVGAVVVALVMALSATLFGVQANQFRSNAEAATRSAQARQIALVADEVRTVTPNIAAQLSVASLRHDESVETRSAVVQSVGSGTPTRATGPAGNTLVGITPSGDLVARADSSGTVTIWRGGLATAPVAFPSGGNQLFTLKLTELDGRTLAFVGGQQTGSVWDLTDTPVLVGEFATDTVVYSAAWFEDRVYFGTLEGEVRGVDLADLAAPEPLRPFVVGNKLVEAIAAGPFGLLVGADPEAALLYTHSGELLAELPIGSRVLSLSLSPDGTEVLAGTARHGGIVYSLAEDADGRPTATERARLDLPRVTFAVLHTGDRFYAGGGFGGVREFSGDGTLLRTWPARNTVISLALTGRTLYVGSTEGIVESWPLDTPNVVTPPGMTDDVYDLTPGGDVVLVGSSAGAQVFHLDGGSWRILPINTVQQDDQFNLMYAMSGDGQVVVNQTTDHRLLTFQRDGDAYQQTSSLPLTESLVDVRLSHSGAYLALGRPGQAGYELWRRTDGGWSRVALLEAWPGGCAFSRDEKLFVSMAKSGQAFSVFSLGDAPQLLTTEAMPGSQVPSGFSFSGSSTLAVGDTPGDITIYDLSTPDTPVIRQRLVEARSAISQLSFADDGKTLLASTKEGLAWAWSTQDDGRLVLDLRLKTGAENVPGAALLGDYILMSLPDRRVVAWPRYAHAQVGELCQELGTPLSGTEWERLVPGVSPINGCP